MSKFTFTPCEIEGLYTVDPTVFRDSRGYFAETYNQREFNEAGLMMNFVQDNQSMSSKGVLRGLHFQKTFPQAKLVRALSGEVLDVAVDLHKGTETYGQWVGVLLSGKNHRQFMIPSGLCRCVGLR